MDIQFFIRFNAVLAILYVDKLLFCMSSDVREFENLNITNIFIGDKYIYLGGVNSIISLNYDNDFSTNKSHKTGPKEDNPQCVLIEYKKSYCGKHTKELLNNYNKILLVTKTPIPMVIVCGTLFRGICEFLDPDTLTQLDIIHENPSMYNRFLGPGMYASANLPDASTTFFIKNSNKETVLITAKTMTYMHPTINLGAVSMISLGKNLNFEKSFWTLKDSLEYFKEFFDKKTNIANYKVDYVSSFSISEYGYFIFNKKKSFDQSLPYISNIALVNIAGGSFKDYVEIEILCESNSLNYNFLLSASVVEKDGTDPIFFGLFRQTIEKTNHLIRDYAICRFSLKEAHTMASDAVTNCNNQMAFVKWSIKEDIGCTTTPKMLAPNKKVFKGDLLHVTTEEASTILGYPHGRGISLYVAKKGMTISMFDVKKDRLLQFNQQTLKVSQPGLFKKMVFGEKKEYIYSISDHSIAKVLVEDCQKRTSCKLCLSGPGCGWCTLENICSTREGCKHSEKDNYYINSTNEMCPSISKVTPNKASIKETEKVTLEVVNIPTDVNYKCSFNGLTVDGSLQGSSLTCNNVSFDKVRLKDFVNETLVTLSLLWGKDKFITSTDFTLYDCNSLNMCKKCTTGVNKCGWCEETLSCMDNSTTNCSTWIPYQGENSEKHKDLCPRITSVSDMYVPNDVEKEIKLIAKALPEDDGVNKYECSLMVEGKKQTTTAKWINPTELTCDTKKFVFGAPISNYTANISVTYGKAQIDTFGLKAVIFKCDIQREDCSICMVAPSNWNCGWCENKQTCSVNEQCTDSNITSKCPRPLITSVTPIEVSIGGGTIVTIEGKDLGLDASEITSITLAGVPCKQNIEKYKISHRIVCTTKESIKPAEGEVVVKVNVTGGKFTSKFGSKFYYRKPNISDFSPKNGSCSGGTIITINGMYLNVGNSVKVFVGKIECGDVLPTRTNITCKTQRSKSAYCTNIAQKKRRKRAAAPEFWVEFDGYKVMPPNQETFSYLEDPIVNQMYTYIESVHAKTFMSGGQVILVRGMRFSLIQKAIMTFRTLDPVKLLGESKCDFQKPYLVCVAPNISDYARPKLKNAPLRINCGFELNGVTIRFVRAIEIVPDPVFDAFENGIRLIITSDLILTGSGLDVIDKKDVTVTVAGLPCEVTDLDKRLVCKVPTETEVLKNSKQLGSASVQVKIGRGNLTYNLGNIKFNKESNETSWYVYVVPAIAGLLILVIIIVILCVLYRRKHKKDKEYQELVQIRMDRMESQYARECKEAFAEYQTEITDLTHDVDQHVSPYLDFPQYAMRVLYPGVSSHPIMEANRDSRPEWEESMRSLVDLLKKQDFVLTFVRTLESQSSFQMTDRCIVASLLMVSLQDNIRYLTIILKILLTDLIQKTATGKRPKLLLRRTESVAEKLLTNWLAYTLHSFLEDTVGEPLFKLFSAINILLEKEPIDAITSDAKNSLSEDKLLRQKIDFTSIILNIEYVTDQETEKFENIQTLSCDTISQAKRKILKFIYKDKPFSLLPKTDDLALGFPTASGAILILRDKDSTNILEGEWKKINTLEHYKVPDKANLRLCSSALMSPNEISNDAGAGVTSYPASPPPRIHRSSMKRRISNSLRSIQDIGRSDAALLNSIPIVTFQPGVSSLSTPMLHHPDVNEPKLWHMVKQQDYQPEQKEELNQNKMMAEVFLTRLLKTKETLQLFVNKLFDSIFGLYEGGRKIPLCVKYMFDFLDEQAGGLENGDDELKHTWKNNSLPLRFWINMIKNPNFIFDIDKSNTVDSCLSVIAQLFMDSCSPDEHRLGKHSPSNKLLYAKEIPEYKKKVKKFYLDVSEHSIDEEEFFKSLDELSEKYGNSFNSCNAARELMSYAVRYKVKLMDSLEQNGFEDYAERLQTIMENMPDD